MIDRVTKELKNKIQAHCKLIGKERKYSNAAVLIPLVEIGGEYHVLFQVRSDHIRQGGEVGFPGGMIEPEDKGDYQETAIRETIEELGVERKQIKTLGYFGTYVAHSDVTIDVYAAEVQIKSIESLELSKEVASVFTVPLVGLLNMEPEIHFIQMRVQQSFVDEEGDEVVMLDIKALGLPEKYGQPWRMRKRKVYFYRYEDYIIWGMTGEILYEFMEILR